MNQDHTPKLVVAAVIGVLLLVLAMSSYAIVPPGHRGVKVTMGKVSDDVVAEGFTWKLPFGITHVELVNVQQQKSEGDAACFSADTQTIQIKFAVMYRLADSKAADLFRNYRGEPYDAIVAPRVQESLKQVTASYQVEELVKKREEARAKTLERLQQRMKEAGGVVEIVDFNLMNIDLSDQVERAIEDKMVIEQEARKKEFESQREKLEADITLIKAKAEAESSRLRGEALANNLLVLQMEIIKKWNGIAPNVVVLGGGAAGTGGAQIILPVVPTTGQQKP
jgi:prohibitin 2